MTTATAGPGILRDGRLAGADPVELAARFGTPFYAYDLDGIDARVEALRVALPPSFDLAFAVKANPLLAILRGLAALGVGADVASGGELGQVRRAGFAADRIVLTGPGTRDVELVEAVEAGVRAITVESLGELRRLDRIAEGRGRVQPVLLRLSMSSVGRDERVRIIGDEGAGKFGMDRSELRAAAAEAVASPWLDPLGIHAFGASNVLDAAVLVGHVEATVATAAAVASEAGFTLRLVDAGGGLGIPYADDEPGLDLDGLGAGLAAIADRLAGDPVTTGTRVLLEPGRFLVGAAGAYVARVTDAKVVDGSRVAILDGGINHVLRPALVGQAHRVVALAAGGSPGATSAHATPDTVPVTIAGPLCTGLDVLASRAPLPPLDPGDLVAVLDVGAYGATESMPFFLSHALPAEVVVRAGRARLARPRIEPETWLDWHVDEPEG